MRSYTQMSKEDEVLATTPNMCLMNCFNLIHSAFSWDAVPHRQPWPPPHLHCEFGCGRANLRPIPWSSFTIGVYEDSLGSGLPSISTGKPFDSDEVPPGVTLTAQFLYHLANKVMIYTSRLFSCDFYLFFKVIHFVDLNSSL